MTRTHDADADILGLLHEAAEWRLLGRLFECPSPAWRIDVARLGREVQAAPLARAARRALRQATEGQYHSTFGPGGPAPPREVSYHASLELGSLMSAIAADYAAFDYQPDTAEAPDHVSVEAGFIAYLRLKEAYALANGEDETAAITRRTADRFAAERLSALATPLASHLAESGVPYLADASRLLADRVGPPRGPHLLPVVGQAAPDDLDDEGGFACDV